MSFLKRNDRAVILIENKLLDLIPVRRLRGYILDFYAQILSDPVGKIYIISLILAVLIYISEGTLVREDADIDLSVRLDLLQRPVTCVCALVKLT